MLILNSSNLTRTKINPFQRHPYITVLGSIPQVLSSGTPCVSNLLKASQKQLFEVRRKSKHH